MSQPSKGVALIGAGIYARSAYLPALADLRVPLVAVYSRSHSSAASLVDLAHSEYANICDSSLAVYCAEAGNPGLAELLERNDVESVVVAMPTTVQPDIVLQCLASGKHVLMEKPIAKDVHSSREFIRECNKLTRPQSLVLAVAEQYRYEPVAVVAREIVARGDLGDLVAAHGRMWKSVSVEDRYYNTAWRKNPQYQGGFLLDGGVHFIAMLRFVTGCEIVKCSSMVKQACEYLPPADTLESVLQYSSSKAGGLSGTFSVCFASSKTAHCYEFIGTKGSLTVTMRRGNPQLVVQGADGTTLVDETVAGNATVEELKAFFTAVQAGQGRVEERGSPHEALRDVAVIESLLSGGGVPSIE